MSYDQERFTEHVKHFLLLNYRICERILLEEISTAVVVGDSKAVMKKSKKKKKKKKRKSEKAKKRKKIIKLFIK